MHERAVFVRDAKISVCPGKWKPAMCIASLFSGPVVIAAMLPASAASIARFT